MSKSWFARNVYDSGDGKEKPDTVEPPDFSKTKNIQPTPSTPVFQTTPQTNYATVPVVTSEDMQKYREHISSVIADNNQQGPDYFEFSQALEKNISMISQRPTAFVVTYNSLLPLGLTKDKLISTAQFYIDAMHRDFEDFKKDREQKRKEQVDGRIVQIQGLQTENDDITKQIQQLSQRMSENTVKIQQLTDEKRVAEQKLNLSITNMENAMNDEINHITLDIQTIQQVIQ